MALLDRHLAFLEALRGAGLPVSLSEGLDAVQALGTVGWGSRAQVHDVYAATLVKRQSQRPTFEALFELYFPRLVGEGARAALLADEATDPMASTDALDAGDAGGAADPANIARDSAAAIADLQDRVTQALADDDGELMRQLATETVGRLGAMPGRGPGLSSWSSYTAMRRLSPDEVVGRLVDGLQQHGWTRDEAERVAHRRVGSFTGLVEADARRRIAEEKGPAHIADVAVRPTIDRLDFLAARRGDLEELRREIYPLARRLATRLTQEHHAHRRGPLDVRRTVRASIANGGVPLDLAFRPKRPHRSELVVLCDVSGSVANFASFTLMLVFALREVFTKVRAFTFVDEVHEVTSQFAPGGDLVDTMTRLAEASAFAARFGRTNYGRAFELFRERHADALGPKTSLLVLGDARSNYSDLALPALRSIVAETRQAWWLNPESRRQWDTGDSAASRYGAVVPMLECRNLTQLGEFVHDLA